MPLGWVGVNSSFNGLLFKELYPLIKCRPERAEKQGLSCDNVKREKKLIWITAIISTPIILPATKPTTNNRAAKAETAEQSVDMIEANL